MPQARLLSAPAPLALRLWGPHPTARPHRTARGRGTAHGLCAGRVCGAGARREGVRGGSALGAGAAEDVAGGIADADTVTAGGDGAAGAGARTGAPPSTAQPAAAAIAATPRQAAATSVLRCVALGRDAALSTGAVVDRLSSGESEGARSAGAGAGVSTDRSVDALAGALGGRRAWRSAGSPGAGPSTRDMGSVRRYPKARFGRATFLAADRRHARSRSCSCTRPSRSSSSEQRFAGSFSMQRATSADRLADTAGTMVARGGGSPMRCARQILLPLNLHDGKLPRLDDAHQA